MWVAGQAGAVVVVQPESSRCGGRDGRSVGVCGLIVKGRAVGMVMVRARGGRLGCVRIGRRLDRALPQGS